jgi:hypothetical protein
MVLARTPKHKQSVSSKKRTGQHHRFTKHYSKTYWPYLPMLLVLVIGFCLNLTWNRSKSVLGYATDVSTTDLLANTNTQRTENGLSALSENSELDQAAQAKANNMVALDYWAHIAPDGETPWQFITDAGYSYVAAGENLAYGFDTSADTVAGWMNSPEHQANILDTSYTNVGFGIANSTDFQGTGPETIVVAEYAEPQVAIAAATTTPTATPQATPTATTQTQPVPSAAATQVPSQPTTSVATQTNVNKPAQVPALASTVAQEPPSKEVARIGVLTDGNAQWASLALSAAATIIIIGLAFEHGRLWRRYIARGESFVIRHPLFDTAMLGVAVLGFILTRTAGFIH